VETVIQDGLAVQGDAGLLHQALENLLENAWKFTERTPEPKIEFGSTVRDGQTVFFVRDNGAGFDMRYVDKLFLPFQRLHTREDFAGAGIGLAIVRRVVQRHGGQVWAAGEPDKGAVFYFTLQQEDSREHGYQEHPAGGG
jgi:signal transduction histidine kinase